MQKSESCKPIDEKLSNRTWEQKTSSGSQVKHKSVIHQNKSLPSTNSPDFAKKPCPPPSEELNPKTIDPFSDHLMIIKTKIPIYCSISS
uniref:Uncharacterized protein n=1 Tax=Sarcophilus harrisii TaxID=9305 RepID=A0A7N4P0K8_SARHA